MAGTTPVDFVRGTLGRFPAGLLYAVLECTLIIILLINGFISIFSNAFARLFGLKTPCHLCIRIDRALIRRDPDSFYQSSICDVHAMEVSFLAYCHVHHRLANVSRMCKGCLLSFAASDGHTDSETYQSLVEVFAANDEFDDDNFVLVGQRRSWLSSGNDEEDEYEDKGGGQRCSCCGEPLRIKEASYHLPRFMRMLSDAGVEASNPSMLRSTSGTAIDQVQYRGLRLTSDTEESEDESSSTASVVASESEEGGGGPTGSTSRRALKSERGLKEEEDSSVSGKTGMAMKESKEMNQSREASPQPPTALANGAPNQFSLQNLQLEGCSPGDIKVKINKGNKIMRRLYSDASRVSATPSPRLSMLRKRLSMRRNETTSGSLKGTFASFNKGEGETLLHRLKRQVRLDRKSLIALCAELEQERSASAVAAIQAMAMINRLQEEKASVHMEALQYQRMMEEQAEYHQEALQHTKGLLNKRDRRIKALVAEAEAYKNKLYGGGGGAGFGGGGGGCGCGEEDEGMRFERRSNYSISSNEIEEEEDRSLATEEGEEERVDM